MKHNLKIGVLLLSMFIITQLIGIYVVNYYSPIKVVNNIQENVTTPNQLPFGLQPPQIPIDANFWTTFFPSILISFVIAITYFLF